MTGGNKSNQKGQHCHPANPMQQDPFGNNNVADVLLRREGEQGGEMMMS